MMANINMILMFSLILHLLVASVYSGRVDSTFDGMKEHAYNTFGAVKDSAGNAMGSVKDTASDAMGSVKNTVWPSHTPASAPNVVAGHPREAPATTGHHHNHQHQQHSHPKFHANGPAPISTTGRYGFASNSVGSMNDAMNRVHKVTIHTATHDPAKPAYNDVTGDPDKAVQDWANDLRKQLGGYAATHQQAAGIKEKDPIPEPYIGGSHKQKVAPAPKSSTTQERLLRQSYKKKGTHYPSVAPTNVASHSPSPMSNEPKKKLHYTVHTANHKFNDVTGYATSTFHDWGKDGHGKAAPVPKSSTTHKRGLGESHYKKHHQIHDLYKSYARSPSPMTNVGYGDAILHNGPDEKLHNSIHASVHNLEKEILPNTANPKFRDVTGDASAVYHDLAKSGHKKAAPVPTSSATHKRGLSESHEVKHSHTPFVAPTTAAHHKHQGAHANSPFPVTKNEYGDPVVHEEPEKKLHIIIHTTHPNFNDVTGDATTIFSDWAKDGHGSRGSKSHSSEASSPRHSPRTHNGNGAPISHSHKKHERNLGQSSSGLGASKTHAHASNARGPIVAGHPRGAPSSLAHGQNKPHKGIVHLAVNGNYNTAKDTFNDVTGDEASAYNDWEKDSRRSYGSHQ